APNTQGTLILSIGVAAVIMLNFVLMFFEPIISDEQLLSDLETFVPQYKNRIDFIFGYEHVQRSLFTPALAL
ncbi:hypothetical protein PMAYCL1PPCAC_15586, partial [Pristionchus mayeri]